MTGSQRSAVSINVDRIVEKEMPLDVNLVRTVDAFSPVAVRAKVNRLFRF